MFSPDNESQAVFLHLVSNLIACVGEAISQSPSMDRLVRSFCLKAFSDFVQFLFGTDFKEKRVNSTWVCLAML